MTPETTATKTNAPAMIRMISNMLGWFSMVSSKSSSVTGVVAPRVSVLQLLVFLIVL